MTHNGQTLVYLRVSSEGQNLARQESIIDYDLDGVVVVFEEKASAASRDRPELKRMLAHARAGDVVKVASVDRLARSATDLNDIIRELKQKGVTITFVKENMTFNPDVKADPYMNALFQMLGVFAELERAISKERQHEGIEKAKKAGKYRGRKEALTADQKEQIRQNMAVGATVASQAKRYGVGRTTIYRALAEAA